MKKLTAVDFVSAVYMDASTHEKPQPITDAEAAALMAEWKAEGTEYPEWMTPAAFATVWNIYCMA